MSAYFKLNEAMSDYVSYEIRVYQNYRKLLTIEEHKKTRSAHQVTLRLIQQFRNYSQCLETKL